MTHPSIIEETHRDLQLHPGICSCDSTEIVMTIRLDGWFTFKKWLSVVAVTIALASQAKADKYAVLIGINTYADSDVTSLTGAAADARSIANALIEVDGFPKDHVHLLVSEQRLAGTDRSNLPSLDGICKELDWLSSVVKSGDTVFFFFAGHGVQYDGQAWLLPFNVNIHGRIAFKNSSLSADKLKELLDLPPCLLICAYDMCRRPLELSQSSSSRAVGFGFRMGELQERSVGSGPMPKADHKFVGGSVSLFACDAGQYSWESPKMGRGFFSKGLEASLIYGADKKGRLTVKNIVDFIEDWVPANVDALGLSESQSPQSYPSSDAVYRQVFATGLKPGISDQGGKTAAIPAQEFATGLKSRDPQDEYLNAFQKGFALYRHKAYREAQLEFEKALRFSSTASVLRILGDCRYLQRDRQGAQDYFNAALAKNPNYSPAYSDLGYLEDVEYHRPQAAVEMYRKAIACDPENPAPVNNLGRVLQELKRLKESLDMFRKAVDLDPNSGLYEANLALELHIQHMDTEAVEHAHRAKSLGLKDHIVFSRLNIQG